MNDTPELVPPWTKEAVRALNAYQVSGFFRPFTCPKSPHGDSPAQALMAIESGWMCPECDYRQYWAHAFMADTKILLHPPARLRLVVGGT